MRVLMIAWEYPPHIIGGLGKHVMELAPALVAEGIEVHILTPLLRGGAPDEVTPTGVHVHRVEPPHMEDYGFITFAQHANSALEQHIRALALGGTTFDIIHAHDWLAASAGAGLKHAWRLPLIATIHATERGRGQGVIDNGYAERINGIEWWLTYEAWRVITCSHFMANQVCEYFNAPKDKIDVVPNGVNMRPSPFATDEERRAFRRRFVTDDQPIGFYVGRIVYEKGLHILVEAWQQVLAQFPGARLIIAGAGNYLDDLRTRARELGVGYEVTFTGFIPDEERDRLYYIADVAVFPSLYEPFGIVALEAMAAHCPVVVADTGGLAEVVRLHETGVTVYPNDPKSLAWGILHTLQHPEWSRERTENAYREVRDQYSWARVARETIAVYERTHAAWKGGTWGVELAQRPKALR